MQHESLDLAESCGASMVYTESKVLLCALLRELWLE
jgi:hypothetical protein